ncbi:MAG TPA: hypothetical protein VLI41_11940 [Phenylobacterium sp.]|uniref:hypothetical protein n=1 Tax=Phenylobacterium sp. TaxID=1871053 RepID=UPI002CC832AB|nr:hypothetical protein [Phenylobacterium sp.]HSV03903.1 hypothetical protein [Phenylobacterium sp.]
MSVQSEAAAPHRVRPFYWSLRRELWENRAIYLAPLAVAAVILAAFVYASHGLARELRIAAHLVPPPPPPRHIDAKALATWATDAPTQAGFALLIPYIASAFAMLATATVVGVFYCLGALYGERRDRTVLFWKSLPVADRTTVAAKAVVPLVVLPVVAIAALGIISLLLLAVSFAVLAGNGLSWDLLLARAPVGRIWALAAYAIVCLALWWAPLMGWLMAVSAWARKTTFVWAIAPPAVLCLFERLAFGSSYAWRFLRWRLGGGLEPAFGGVPPHPRSLPTLDQLTPLRFLADPGLWGGLAAFLLLLAACVWLRRRGDPI